MTLYTGTTVHPLDDMALPKVQLIQYDDGTTIPQISFEDGHGEHRVNIDLGSHPNPAAYLRTTAARLLGLAEEVDAYNAKVGAR